MIQRPRFHLPPDNDWSQEFALRVVEEYKRFAYLAFTAGHEVTPSDEVDQAWHLHLTYTRHYWGPFKDALGGPLHHGPTKGGNAENTRYQDNYSKTQKAYLNEFGVAPPEDIWPPSAVRFGAAPFMQRICTRDFYLIPKRQIAMGSAIMALGAALTSMFAVTANAASDGDGARTTAVFIGAGVAITGGLLAVLLALASQRKSGKKRSGTGGTGCGGGKSSSDGDGSGCGGGGCGGCGG